MLTGANNTPLPLGVSTVFLLIVECFAINDGVQPSAICFRLSTSTNHEKEVRYQAHNRFRSKILRLVFLAKRNLPRCQCGAQFLAAEVLLLTDEHRDLRRFDGVVVYPDTYGISEM